LIAFCTCHTKEVEIEQSLDRIIADDDPQRLSSNNTHISHNMADAAAAAPARGGFGSRGGDRGDRGRGRGRRGPRRGGNKDESKEWQPVTKLGRLVKAGKIRSMEEIYLHSLPIKEYQIVDHFLPTLKDEVMKVSRLDFSGDLRALETEMEMSGDGRSAGRTRCRSKRSSHLKMRQHTLRTTS
jgi:hypothetical protein